MKSRNVMRGSVVGAAAVSTVGALVAGLIPAAEAGAGVAFKGGSSSVTLTHDRDINTSDTLFRRSPSPVPKSSQIYPIYPYQLQRKVGPDDSTFSQAFGSLGHITNGSTASFALATGTGVTQTDPDGAFTGSSSLRLNIDLRWNVLSGGFGPIATGFGSISAGGVVGSEGSASVLINLSFTDGTGKELRPDWVVNDVLTTPGSFAKTYTTTNVLGTGSLAPASELRVQGTIEFRASNDGTPSHITPLDAEFGGTPETGTFFGQSGLWHDPSNWVSPFPTQHQGETPLVVANAAGQRARFLEAEGDRVIQLNDSVTLGTLQIDSDKAHTFESFEGGRISFVSTSENNAVLEVRNNFFFNRDREVGAPTEVLNPSHDIGVDLELVSALDLHQNVPSDLRLAGEISGTGALTKLGVGRTLLNGAGNRYSGGTFIQEGILVAGATGSLGLEDVVVSGLGQLDYNAKNAASVDSAVIVQANGTLNLGIVPDATERLDIRGLGAVRGNPEELRAMTVGQNLLLAENAMIVHEGGAGDPGGLGTEPRFLYGIGGEFAGVVPAVGSETDGPWRGFGAGAGITALGTPAGGSALNVEGDATIAVLGSGILAINTPINTAGNAVITKTGLGAMVVNAPENGFSGRVNVEQGLLLVNGVLKAEVAAGAETLVGGNGTIEGAVDLGPAAHLSPGNAVAGDELNIGLLRVAKLSLAKEAFLDFEFRRDHDRVEVAGDLLLDGILNVWDSQEFGPGLYPLFTFGGELDDQGLEMGFAPVIFNYEIVVKREGGEAGTVFLQVSEVPEPGVLALVGGGLLMAGMRRRRS